MNWFDWDWGAKKNPTTVVDWVQATSAPAEWRIHRGRGSSSRVTPSRRCCGWCCGWWCFLFTWTNKVIYLHGYRVPFLLDNCYYLALEELFSLCVGVGFRPAWLEGCLESVCSSGFPKRWQLLTSASGVPNCEDQAAVDSVNDRGWRLRPAGLWKPRCLSLFVEFF